MRLAVFSDIHGNPIALEAVLADIKARGGADQYWILGDLAVGGYDPSGALQRLYVLIDSGASHPQDLQVQHHRVEYAVSAVIAALHSSGHPTAESPAEHFQGKRQPPWLRL